MALDSGQVRLAPMGHVYTAPVGTAGPADVTVAWPVGWTELGYLDEEGVAVTPTTDIEEYMAWQSAVAVKTSLTSIGLDLKFNLIQINQSTTGLYFFGNDWSVSGGLATLTMVSNPELDERALGVEWTDDAGSVNRLIMQRGVVTEREDMMINRKDLTATGVTFKVLEYAGNLATLLSDDPNLLAS